MIPLSGTSSPHPPDKAQPHSHHHLWRNINQHPSKRALLFPSSLIAACTAHCAFQCLQHRVLPVPKPSPGSCAKPANPHTWKFASTASSPIRAGEGTGFSPLSDGFWRSAGCLCQSPPSKKNQKKKKNTTKKLKARHWHSWDSHGAWLSAQNTWEIVLAAGTKQHLPSSHTPGADWSWQEQRRGSSASFPPVCPTLPHTTWLTTHPQSTSAPVSKDSIC